MPSPWWQKPDDDYKIQKVLLSERDIYQRVIAVLDKKGQAARLSKSMVLQMASIGMPPRVAESTAGGHDQ